MAPVGVTRGVLEASFDGLMLQCLHAEQRTDTGSTGRSRLSSL